MTETPAPQRTPPKTPPRFVPTLTEVVPQAEVMPVPGATELTPEMLDRLVSQATRRASEALMRKLPELIVEAVQNSLPEVVEHMRTQVEAQALQSVRATLTRTGWQLPAAPLPPIAAAPSGEAPTTP